MPRMSYTTHNAAPDSENIVKTDLTASARPLQTFKGPVALNIPEAPQDNSLNDLGEALSRLNPSLNAFAKQVVDSRSAAEIAQAHEDSRKAQADNVANLKNLQAQDLIPNGASPNYIRAWKGNFLKLNAERGRQLMQEAYYANDELRNSDDPDAFTKFAQEWKSKYDQTNNVIDGYTPLEIHDSRYHETLSGAAEELHGQQIRYRVGEREKAAVNTASDLVMERLDFHLDHAVDAPDLNEVAAAINDVFTNQTTGMMSYGGMKGSQVNEVLTEAIITKAMSAGDASILDVADKIVATSAGSPNATLARTRAFREKAETARQAIANKNWQADQRERQLAAYRGDGTELPSQVEARAREERQRVVEEHEAARAARQDKTKERTTKQATDLDLTAIMKLHAIDGDTMSPELNGFLKSIAQVDPQLYQSTTTWLQNQHNRKEATVNEAATLREFTKLRAELSSSPESFKIGSIVEAANAGRLTAGQVQTLFNEAESNKKTAQQYPALNSALMRDMRSDLKAAVQKDETGEYGEARLKSDKAAFELNQLAAAYMKSHPKASEYDLYVEMNKHMETIARKHSPDLDSTMKGQEKRQAEQQEQAQEREQMQSRAEAEVKQLRSQPQQNDERSKLDEALKAKGYKSAKQRAEIIERLLREQKGSK